MTMPARYDGPAFMAELEAAGGDFTALSNTVAARDGALPPPTSWPVSARPCCTAGSRPVAARRAPDPLRHPPARHHRGVPLARRVPEPRIVAGPRHRGRDGDRPNLFGVDLSGVDPASRRPRLVRGLGRRCRAPRRRWPSWPAAASLPAGRLGGEAAARFSQALTAGGLRRRGRRRPAGVVPPRLPGPIAAGQVAGLVKPSSRSEAAARLEAYPSEHTTMTCWSYPDLGQRVAARRDRSATRARCARPPHRNRGRPPRRAGARAGCRRRAHQRRGASRARRARPARSGRGRRQQLVDRCGVTGAPPAAGTRPAAVSRAAAPSAAQHHAAGHESVGGQVVAGHGGQRRTVDVQAERVPVRFVGRRRAHGPARSRASSRRGARGGRGRAARCRRATGPPRPGRRR